MRIFKTILRLPALWLLFLLLSFLFSMAQAYYLVLKKILLCVIILIINARLILSTISFLWRPMLAS
jgi:hypothetical protein